MKLFLGVWSSMVELEFALGPRALGHLDRVLLTTWPQLVLTCMQYASSVHKQEDIFVK